MTPQELQDKIDYLIDIEKNLFFSLQDKNLGQAVKKANSVFFPMQGRKFIDNQTIIRQELVPYVYNNPKKYILYYGRTPRYHNAEHLEIDTRDNDTLTPNNNTLQDMDDRTPEQKRQDVLRTEKMGEELGELRAEVRNLNKEIKRLEQEKQNLADQLEQEIAGNDHAQMADATTSTIGQVAQIVPMLFDKYFAIQERKNELLAEQIRRQAPPRPQPQNQTFEQPVNGFNYEG